MHPLKLIGYWRSETESQWPDPRDFVDEQWDEDERKFIADYLDTGIVARAFMGLSPCRLCGMKNGSLEFTDGTYIWPQGLTHYVRDHGVRLPVEFVDHASAFDEEIGQHPIDSTWWASVSSNE